MPLLPGLQTQEEAMSTTPQDGSQPTVVLVHGAFMGDSQVPWGVEALSGTISEAVWRSKPSWYLLATEDGMIPRRPSARCLSKRGRPLRRPRAAMRSMCHSRQP
jgi:hypothetical protein